MKQHRNWIIVITSITYFLIVLYSLFFAFTGNLTELVGKEPPLWYVYFIYITSLIYTIGFIFILKMKRLALVTLSFITVFGYLFSYIVDIFNVQSLIIDIIIFGTLWTQYKKMR